MKGKLFGIGLGPGDPELLTLKAVSTIKKCGVIAVPKTIEGENVAFSIVEPYLHGKELLECRFIMEIDMAKRQEARRIAAAQIIAFLDTGKHVGFVTLGDPTTYSTYMYVHEIVMGKGFDAEIIPGVTSYAAAAAALGLALCEDNDTLTLIPANHCDNLDVLLDTPGNKVIMKSGGNLRSVLEKLKEHGLAANTAIASRVTMDGERLYASIDEYEKSPETGYFTVAIVKGKKINHET